MEWSKEATCRLIELFREKPELWDTTNVFYKYRQKKRDAWVDIAKAMNLDRMEVERKMRSVIGQYQRERKKVAPGSGVDEEQASRWFAFKHLMFLRDFTKTKPRRTHNSEIQEIKIEADEPPEPAEQENSHEQVGNNSEILASAQTLRNTSVSFKKVYRPPQTRKMVFKRKCYEKPAPAYAVMKSLNSRLERDDYHIFGELVACKIRNLRTSYAKSTVQYQINKLLYHAELGEFDEHPLHDIHGTSDEGSSSLPLPSPEPSTSGSLGSPEVSKYGPDVMLVEM